MGNSDRAEAKKEMTVQPGLEGHRQRLRQRFRMDGLAGFHDHEILELLLTFAIPRRDVKPIAKALLASFGSNLAAVFDASAEDLERCPGVGAQAAVLIRLLPRLFDAYQASRWQREQTFTSAADAAGFLSALLGTERNEIFCVLALDSQNRLIAVEKIQEGSVNRTAVFPRLIVEASLRHRATAVILAHNHPGGGAQPSQADRQLTRRLKLLLKDLDIVVHDHIIVAGPNQHYSFAQQGGLE
ncbi:MAG: DNA repair protein RadC [Desulfobacteraceae bacterium]|nr:DNA repair protein RadC [Desulfobacteraceae bacterium]